MREIPAGAKSRRDAMEEIASSANIASGILGKKPQGDGFSIGWLPDFVPDGHNLAMTSAACGDMRNRSGNPFRGPNFFACHALMERNVSNEQPFRWLGSGFRRLLTKRLWFV